MPRRILLVAPQPFFRVTGTPISVLMMCRALSEHGLAVDLATLPHGEDIAVPGLRLHRTWKLPLIRQVRVGFSPVKLVYNLLLLGTVGRLLLCRRYVAVHAVEEAAFYAVPLARLLAVPAVADLDSDVCQQLREHGSAISRRLVGPARALRRFALRRSNSVVAVARHLGNIARSESPSTPVFEIQDAPLDEVARPPDPVAMAALRARLGLEEARLVVYTGNLDRRQGIEELIRAMPAVRTRHPQAALLIAGGEPARIQALQALASALGLTEKAVRLIGPRPPASMPEIMGVAEVLVSPRLEPYITPLKLFSYMVSGRPIVATDLPTHTEILDASTAVLVPPDAAGLAAGIMTVLDDPEAAAVRGARARAKAHEHHTFAGFKRRLLEVYDLILAPPATPEAEEIRLHGRARRRAPQPKAR